MGMQWMEWISTDDGYVEEYKLANILDPRQEIGTQILDVAPIWSEELGSLLFRLTLIRLLVQKLCNCKSILWH